jgi:transposase
MGITTLKSEIAAGDIKLSGEKSIERSMHEWRAFPSHFKRIGLEAGPLWQWLFSALAEAGLPVICVKP